MSENCILEMQSISYSYDDEHDALKDISMSLYPGEKVALLGNNGAGKSTFFLCGNGVLRPKAGEILHNGKRLSRAKSDLSELRRSVGLVFQEPDDQIIASTVEGEISFGPMNLRLPEKEVRERVEQAMETMELSAYRSRPPHYLSGGEKKRVTIADILAMRPEILFFDEPTSSLDPQNSMLLEKTLSKLAGEGMAVVISTHDVELAWRWAKRILVFNDGHILADARPEDVFADDRLIEKAGLKKPILFEASAALMQKNPELANRPMPKTTDEFTKFIS